MWHHQTSIASVRAICKKGKYVWHEGYLILNSSCMPCCWMIWERYSRYDRIVAFEIFTITDFKWRFQISRDRDYPKKLDKGFGEGNLGNEKIATKAAWRRHDLRQNDSNRQPLSLWCPSFVLAPLVLAVKKTMIYELSVDLWWLISYKRVNNSLSFRIRL